MRYASFLGFACVLLMASLPAAGSAFGGIGCPESVTFPGGSVLTQYTFPQATKLLGIAISPNGNYGYIANQSGGP